ncbi:uncharacterized protein LOC120142363 isoform X3 [Hibiscus syriacus]|uniref:uncharacterized protein LOC120142363 isoform X3 n=1 Tax=Hibiscus syriacus TaxID=106335 RepID=UPI0019238190|nr:uncharacterized protein LOC120142363 isoform X3 [Hibiscus syriacus]
MENGGAEKGNGQAAAAASYTYWVRETTADAAPLPLPKKLTAQDLLWNQSQPATLGSAWNKELLKSVGTLDLPRGIAEISELTKCVSDAFLVTVRNKKRVGYTYELTLKIEGKLGLNVVLGFTC